MKPGLLGAAVLAAVVTAARAEAPPLSAPAQSALQQVLKRQDNAGAPFMLIDKKAAHLWLFDAQGRPQGGTPVLLGHAVGDDSVPGIGERPIKAIQPHERTTPAGRFVAQHGRNASGEDILWVDYDAAVSMHRVRATNPVERRLQRLASPTSADNRISYGCINLPAAFYDGPLARTIGAGKPVVYVLPETRPVDTLFAPATKRPAPP